MQGVNGETSGAAGVEPNCAHTATGNNTNNNATTTTLRDMSGSSHNKMSAAA
jgi:hypothetical protein